MLVEIHNSHSTEKWQLYKHRNNFVCYKKQNGSSKNILYGTKSVLSFPKIKSFYGSGNFKVFTSIPPPPPPPPPPPHGRKEMWRCTVGDLIYSGDLNSELLMFHYSNGLDALYHGRNSQLFE